MSWCCAAHAASLRTLRIASCRYAWECQTQEGGWGLDGVLRDQAWKLRGIVNGIDTSDWSPQQDRFLRSDGYTNYDIDNLVDGKARCKAALQRVRPALRQAGRRAWPVRVRQHTSEVCRLCTLSRSSAKQPFSRCVCAVQA